MNDALEKLMFEELRNACRGGGKYLRDWCMIWVKPPCACIRNSASVEYLQGMIKT